MTSNPNSFQNYLRGIKAAENAEARYDRDVKKGLHETYETYGNDEYRRDLEEHGTAEYNGTPKKLTETVTISSTNIKKRGRPKKSDDHKNWEDDEIAVLIEIWSQFENLYNTKHKMSFNREERQKSLEAIEKALNDQSITSTTKQISKKLTDLKNYYGAQKRTFESSKASGCGTDDVYVSQWKFFESLSFLKDAFTPRRTHSNADGSGPYKVTRPPSAKSARKIADAQVENANKVMESAASALEKLVASRESNNEQQNPSQKIEAEKSDDEIYCEMLHRLLTQVPDGDDKDDLKLRIQQLVINTKRNTMQSQPLRLNHVMYHRYGMYASRTPSPALNSPPPHIGSQGNYQ